MAGVAAGGAAFLELTGLLDLGDFGDFSRGDLVLGDFGERLPSLTELASFELLSSEFITSNGSGWCSIISSGLRS